DTAAKVADALGVSLDKLAGREQDLPPEPGPEPEPPRRRRGPRPRRRGGGCERTASSYPPSHLPRKAVARVAGTRGTFDPTRPKRSLKPCALPSAILGSRWCVTSAYMRPNRAARTTKTRGPPVDPATLGRGRFGNARSMEQWSASWTSPGS